MDLKDIILGDYTLYQYIGAITIIGALFNLFAYLIYIVVFSKTHTETTRSLRNNSIAEGFLTITTIMMGMGALFETSQAWWQFSYVMRAGILIITPFVFWRLVKAVYFVTHDHELTFKVAMFMVKEYVKTAFSDFISLFKRK